MEKKIAVGSRLVGEGEPCYVVAEAGVNHNGDLSRARRLIEEAQKCGADAVKFQKRTVEEILIGEMLDRSYTGPNVLGPTYGEHRRKLELGREAWYELSELAKTLDISFFASPWDLQSADFLEELGVPAFKIASADLTNLPLLEHIAKKHKPMLVSTGMSSMEEVAEAIERVQKFHNDIILLHCVSTYPCDNENVNLRVMETLRRRFDMLIRYSGHERGIAIPCAAVALGAVVIEKHFTLDRTLQGPDHAASLEPQGLERLVHYTRMIESAMGDEEKRFLDRERPIRDRLAKSVVTRCEVQRGTVITKGMLAIKGPGTGIPPSKLQQLYGKVARVDLEQDRLVPLEALDW